MNGRAAAQSATAALVATLAGVVAWRVRRRASTPSGPETEWTCACGQQFRFTGTGRHRIYWRVESGPEDPVVGQRCPSCDRPLPADRDLSPATS
jgi:hypothetical protein